MYLTSLNNQFYCSFSSFCEVGYPHLASIYLFIFTSIDPQPQLPLSVRSSPYYICIVFTYCSKSVSPIIATKVFHSIIDYTKSGSIDWNWNEIVCMIVVLILIIYPLFRILTISRPINFKFHYDTIIE